MSEQNLLTTHEDDELSFAEDTVDAVAEQQWKVLVVDDDDQVHVVTKFALQDFSHQGRQLHLLHAKSSAEAKIFLKDHPDIAIILLDVVMEEDDAGLKLVKYIRNVLNNNHVRIVLRTGQPGMAPERQVIENFDIDDYRTKTELTSEKLYTTIVGGLRAFKEIIRIERVVEERTHEIQEINSALKTVNKDLLDSINYARRIQLSILPSIQTIHSFLPRFFAYYEPKDIVSGDFYWFFGSGPDVYFAAADCTGHGVPGALMSVLSHSLLNYAIKAEPGQDPAKVLERVRDLLQTSMNNHRSELMSIMNHSADGMDVGLCRLNRETLKLEFAGARRPLYYVPRGGELQVHPGTRCSIDPFDKRPFELVSLQMQKGDICYILTDGITDQFGGPKNRKYSTRRFQEFIQSIQDEPFEQHQRLIDFEIRNWQGDNVQTDDLLVLGMLVD
ncbi:MAG: SpoIIE family protein phosphatase [Bacteroidia bacterium]|nr:SpoIIE family protein phosphatase [Bacteroidia bacterium]